MDTSSFLLFIFSVMLSVIPDVQNALSMAGPILACPTPLPLLMLSPVMSLSQCESLGYQCSASDRKRVIKKLSCFSPPSSLLPSLTLRDEDSCCSQRHFSSSSPTSSSSTSSPFSSALLSWMAGSHRCVTIITRKLGGGKNSNNAVSSI